MRNFKSYWSAAASALVLTAALTISNAADKKDKDENQPGKAQPAQKQKAQGQQVQSPKKSPPAQAHQSQPSKTQPPQGHDAKQPEKASARDVEDEPGRSQPENGPEHASKPHS